jgi:hypothetical protein
MKDFEKLKPQDVPDSLTADKNLHFLDELKREELAEKYPGLSIEEIHSRLGKEKFEELYGPLQEFLLAETFNDKRPKASLREIVKDKKRYEIRGDMMTERPTARNQMRDYNETLDAIPKTEAQIGLIQEEIKKLGFLVRNNPLSGRGQVKKLELEKVERDLTGWRAMKTKAENWLNAHYVRIPEGKFSDQEIQQADDVPEIEEKSRDVKDNEQK